MCIAPIKIKNNSRRYRDGIDKMFFYVPCGHCKECLKQQQDDWFVRAFFEAKRVEKCHGHIFLPTFTYSDDWLPHWYDFDRNFHVQCFSYEHIKAFRDKLRNYLSRDWYIYTDDEGHSIYVSCASDSKGDRFRKKYNEDTHYKLFWKGIISHGLRFILVPEFGTHTGRAHYHGILFCPFDISIVQMLFFLRKAWIYGFVGVPKDGLECKGHNGLQYFMKYVSKPQHWFKKYGIYDYIALLKEDIDKGVDDAEDTLKEFRRCLPKHFQSTNFGAEMLQYVTDQNLLDNKINLSEFGFITKNKFKFSLPRYIVRRLCTYKDEFDLDNYTTRYQDLFKEMWLLSLNHDYEKYYFMQTFEALKSHLSPLHLPEDQIKSIWLRLSKIKDIRYLIVYDRVYRNVPLNCLQGSSSALSKFYDNYDVYKDKLEYFMENSLEFAINQKFGFDGVPAEKGEQPLQTQPQLFSDERVTFAHLPCFDGFEDALLLIEQFQNDLGKLVDAAWRIKDNQSKSQFKHKTWTEYESFV